MRFARAAPGGFHRGFHRDYFVNVFEHPFEIILTDKVPESMDTAMGTSEAVGYANEDVLRRGANRMTKRL